MWKNNKENFQSMGFSTPPPPSSKLRSCRSPVRVMSERKRTSPSNNCGVFHIIHKVPAGDSPYVRAKQVQVRHFFGVSGVVCFAGFCLLVFDFGGILGFDPFV